MSKRRIYIVNILWMNRQKNHFINIIVQEVSQGFRQRRNYLFIASIQSSASKIRSFLAPTGALGVTISVRPFVCPFGSNLSRAVNLSIRSESNQRAIEQSESTQRALRALKPYSYTVGANKYCVLLFLEILFNYSLSLMIRAWCSPASVSSAAASYHFRSSTSQKQKCSLKMPHIVLRY